MIFKTLPILAATTAFALVGSAHAQTYLGDDGYVPQVGEVVVIAPGVSAGGREIKRVPVYFDDLNLHSPQGGYTLLMRIRGAATQACSPAATMPGPLQDLADYQHCVRRAVAHAVHEVGAPSVQDAFYDLGVGTADLPG